MELSSESIVVCGCREETFTVTSRIHFFFFHGRSVTFSHERGLGNLRKHINCELQKLDLEWNLRDRAAAETEKSHIQQPFALA